MPPISLHGARLKRCSFVYTYVRAALPCRPRSHAFAIASTLSAFVVSGALSEIAKPGLHWPLW